MSLLAQLTYRQVPVKLRWAEYAGLAAATGAVFASYYINIE
jgi:hypothetical protein